MGIRPVAAMKDGRDMDAKEALEQLLKQALKGPGLEPRHQAKTNVVVIGFELGRLQAKLDELKADIQTMGQERDELNDEFNSYKDDNEDLQESLDAERRKVAARDNHIKNSILHQLADNKCSLPSCDCGLCPELEEETDKEAACHKCVIETVLTNEGEAG